MEEVFNIQFSRSSGTDSRPSLLIEQEEWITNTGFLTKASLYNALFALLSGSIDVNTVDCGFDADGSLSTVIHVFPDPVNLNYSLKTTYGTLSSRQIQIYLQEEVIDFSIVDSGSLKYHPNASLDYHWIGEVRDSVGAIIPAPVVTINAEGNIVLSKKVYGSLHVEYMVTKYSYLLNIEARPEVESDLFGSVVYGVFSGGVVWLELSTPPNVDDLATGAVECGGTSVGDTDDGDGSERPPKWAPVVNKRFEYDYCSQDLIGHSNEYQ